MPQLNTATWFITILSMLISLFIIFQLKISTYSYNPNPQTLPLKYKKQEMPWEKKWTKTYLPLLPHQH
ncbi:ATP synthase F0 subunit 8 (mitochondrion) [Chinchilla lanigera]|uniref:ATP synthase complex subunit 8 n=1 Tax=Chinchilla lanigera TaxID=34839 RepID=M9NWV7_CHILA|nr:ATP synthase F0 subunit 8 [Chinchilla lanigera]AFQ55781.1 ATP synthase F0 subunit 8 [Chinchilla lanigera]